MKNEIAAGNSIDKSSSNDLAQEFGGYFIQTISDLGKTPQELFESYDMCSYTWYGSEAEIITAGDTVFLFSDSIKNLNSVCSSIIIKNPDQWPFYDVMAQCEDNLVFHSENLLDFYHNGFYEITSGEFVFRFILDEGGNELISGYPNVQILEKNSIISPESERGAKTFLEKMGKPNFAPNTYRVGKAWDAIGRYSQDLGVALNLIENNAQIVNDYDKEVYAQLFAVSGFSDQDGVQYFSTGPDNICTAIAVPILSVFPDETYPINAERVETILSTPYSWSGYTNYSYYYEFEDLKVLIFSDEDGAIDTENFVVISLY